MNDVCQVSIISESSVIILVGFLLGTVLPTDGSILCWAMGTVDVETEGLVMASFLNLFLLPVIIFEAGWSMMHRDFINQLRLEPQVLKGAFGQCRNLPEHRLPRLTILTFAVLGTLISMVVVGSLILSTCHIHGICSAAFLHEASVCSFRDTGSSSLCLGSSWVAHSVMN